MPSVFCGSVLSTVWVKRSDVARIQGMNLFFLGLLVFFSSIVVFGIWTAYLVLRLQNETVSILAGLNVSADILSEFVGVQVGVAIGTTSFAFVVVLWIGIWRLCRAERTEIQRAERSLPPWPAGDLSHETSVGQRVRALGIAGILGRFPVVAGSPEPLKGPLAGARTSGNDEGLRPVK